MHLRTTFAIALLAATLTHAATLSTDKEGYIRHWLLVGPFPSEPTADNRAEGLTTDFFRDRGGETLLAPTAGQSVDPVTFVADQAKLIAKVGSTNVWGYKDSLTLNFAWKEFHVVTESPIFDLNAKQLGDPPIRDYYVAYLVTYIHSETDRRATLAIGSDDAFRAFVNGQCVGEWNSGSRGAVIDNDKLPIVLQKGWNTLIVKIADLTNDSGAVVRLLDADAKTPLANVTLSLTLPQHRFLTLCRDITRIDTFDEHTFAQIDSPTTSPIFVGRNTLSARVGTDADFTGTVKFSLQTGSSITFAKTLPATLKSGQSLKINEASTWTSAGPATLTIDFIAADGKNVGHLTHAFTLLGKKELTDRHAELASKLAAQKKLIAEKKTLLDSLRAVHAKRQQRLDAQIADMAKRFATARDKIIASYSGRGNSTNDPFTPANIRQSVCINGDLWQIAPVKNTGRGSVDESFIPITGWETVTVPTYGIEYYFQGFMWPKKQGEQYTWSPYAQTVDTDLACGFAPGPGREPNGMYLRTTFDVPAEWLANGRRILLSADRVHYKARIWLNDTLVGEHINWCDPVEMDLTPFAKAGTNTLRVFVGRDQIYPNVVTIGILSTKDLSTYWGMMGDVTLINTPAVRVVETTVVTSWRQAMLTTTTTLANTTNTPQTITLTQQAVKDGRVHLTGETQTVTVPANGTLDVTQHHPWADPQLWNVGSPNLYRLVSTLRNSASNAVIDQHFQRFGFRELWISQYDYWLNGQRIFLQGDVEEFMYWQWPRQFYTFLFTALRNTGNINLIRTHFDSNQHVIAGLCDELGMLYMPQSYSVHDDFWANMPKTDADVKKYAAGERFAKVKAEEKKWVHWLRNHPSVVIFCTDNETFTHAIPPKDYPQAILNDRCAAMAADYVESLDPTRLVTRSGDQGTWGRTGAWQQNPPAKLANVHYPDFYLDTKVRNWQSVFGKPVMFGETLYCHYGVWDGWVGATPAQVAHNEQRLTAALSVYRDEKISGWCAMGLSYDGFIELKEGGSCWDFAPQPKDAAERLDWYAAGKCFPGMRLRWPSQSGPGLKTEFGPKRDGVHGFMNINWYVPDAPAFVPNAANRAYKANTHPMPAAPTRRSGEVVYTLVKNGQPLAGAIVLLTPLSGQATEPIGLRADLAGRAWFLIDQPGDYMLTVVGEPNFKKKVTITDLPNDLKPGLNTMPQLTIDVAAQ